MSDAPDNIVLAQLRSIRTDLSAVKVDTAAIRRHVTSIGLDVARLRQDAAADAVNRSHGEERADLLEDRLARIEAHLGLGDAS